MKKLLISLLATIMSVLLLIPGFAGITDYNSISIPNEPIRINTKVRCISTTDTTYIGEVLTVPFTAGESETDYLNQPVQEYTFEDHVTATGLIKRPSNYPKFRYILKTRVYPIYKDSSGNWNLADGYCLESDRSVYNDSEGNMVDENGNRNVTIQIKGKFRKNTYYAVTQHLKSVDRFSGQFHESYHNSDFQIKDQMIRIKDPNDDNFVTPEIPYAGIPNGFDPNSPPMEEPVITIRSVAGGGSSDTTCVLHNTFGENNSHSVTDKIFVKNLIPNETYIVTGKIYQFRKGHSTVTDLMALKNFNPAGETPYHTYEGTITARHDGTIETVIQFEPYYYEDSYLVQTHGMYGPYDAETGYQTYLITQELVSEKSFYFSGSSEPKQHRAVHINTGDLSQVFYVKKTEFTPTPEPTPPEEPLSSVSTIVSYKGASADATKALEIQAPSGKTQGDSFSITVEDHVKAESLVSGAEYDLITRVMKKDDSGGGMTEVYRATAQVQTYYGGSIDHKVPINFNAVVGSKYVVYQQFVSKYEFNFSTPGGAVVYKKHTVSHENPNTLSQTFYITGSEPNQATPQPEPQTEPNPEPEEPEPQPSQAAANTTGATETTHSTSTDITTSTSQESGAVSTTAVTSTEAKSTTESTSAPTVPITVTTESTTEISIFASLPTPPTTTRTFEYIDIFEEIPLAVRTTAPLDLEEILIEESIPLGGIPYSDINPPIPGLPYTGVPNAEIFIGIGLLIVSIGLCIKR